MKKLLVVCLVLLVAALLGTVTLTGSPGETIQFAWDANTEADLAGYRLFSRIEGSSYDYATHMWEGPEVLTPEFATTIFADGIWFWVVRAFDSHGNVSEDSNEVTYDVDNTAPAAPGACRKILKRL